MLAREIKVGGGVGGEEALAAEPGEESSHAAESSDLGVDGEGYVAAQRAVLVEVVLVGGEVGAGEVFDLGV